MNLSQTSRSTDVDAFNLMLSYLGLMPVQATTNLLGDHAIAYNKFVATHRRVAAKGWHCFNKVLRHAPTYDTILGAYTLASPAFDVKTSARTACDPLAWPRVRLNAAGRLVRLDDGTTVFAEDERTLLVDVVWALPISEAPEQYQSFVAIMAAMEIGPAFGTAVNGSLAANALDELQVLESDATPIANVFDTNPELIDTVWSFR